jgi:hypothetical protein
MKEFPLKHKGELPHLSTGSFMDNVKFAISLDCLAFFERYEATEVSEAAAYRECETLVGFGRAVSTFPPIMTVGGVIMHSMPFSARKTVALPPSDWRFL